MEYKISMVSLGCSKNLIDSELMIGNLSEKGYTFINEEEKADIIIVNTCGFIDSAKEESIDAIIEAGKYKSYGKCKVLIVSGCMAERYKEELIREIPEVDGVIGTGNINEVNEVVNEVLKGNKVNKTGNINSEYLEGYNRISTTPSYTSYIKIAEGCDNFCTYCIIPKLRGRFRSRTIEAIVKEAEKLASNGTKELILIAQDTSKYGIDMYDEYKLPDLLDKLNTIEGLEWIRVLYLYPDSFNDELINSIKRNEKVVNYVDMPIQHISDTVLKRMNRKTSKISIENIINKLREEIPNIIIRTTLIVGFPGETEEEFNELYDFVKKVKFDRLGAFSYSKEDDTPAAKMEYQVEDETKELRKNKIMELQQEISYMKNKEKLGNVYKTLIEEEIENNLYLGRTYMDSPEIDCIVYINSRDKLNPGDFVSIKVTDHLEYDIMGEIADESSK